MICNTWFINGTYQLGFFSGPSFKSSLLSGVFNLKIKFQRVSFLTKVKLDSKLTVLKKVLEWQFLNLGRVFEELAESSKKVFKIGNLHNSFFSWQIEWIMIESLLWSGYPKRYLAYGLGPFALRSEPHQNFYYLPK